MGKRRHEKGRVGHKRGEGRGGDVSPIVVFKSRRLWWGAAGEPSLHPTSSAPMKHGFTRHMHKERLVTTCDICWVAIGIDSKLCSTSHSAAEVEHQSDCTRDGVDVNSSSCCNQHHARPAADRSKHQATPHHHHYHHHHHHHHNHHHQCVATPTAADGAAGNHGNREDADDSPAQYMDVCHNDGTCQHADWWKHKVTCHWPNEPQEITTILLRLCNTSWSCDVTSLAVRRKF